MCVARRAVESHGATLGCSCGVTRKSELRRSNHGISSIGIVEFDALITAVCSDPHGEVASRTRDRSSKIADDDLLCSLVCLLMGVIYSHKLVFNDSQKHCISLIQTYNQQQKRAHAMITITLSVQFTGQGTQEPTLLSKESK